MLKNKLSTKKNLIAFLLLITSSAANAQDSIPSAEVAHDVSSLPSLLGMEQPKDDSSVATEQSNSNRSSVAPNSTKRTIYVIVRNTRRSRSRSRSRARAEKFQDWTVDAWKTADSCGSESSDYVRLTHYVYTRGNNVSLRVPAGYRYDGYRLHRGFDVYGSVNHGNYTANHNFRYYNERGRQADVYMESHFNFYDGYSCYITYQGVARR